MLAAWGCNPSTTRPLFLPYPEASTGAVRAARPQLVARVAAWLDSAGMTVAVSNARDGYVETRWGRSARSDSSSDGHGAAQFKLRVWVDPDVIGSSRLVVEAVYRPLLDPSRSSREQEKPVPEDHPGARLGRELIEAMRQWFGTTDGEP